MASKSGAGTTVSFGSAMVEITSISFSGASRASIDTSYLALAASGTPSEKYRTKIPGELIDTGTCTLTCNMDDNLVGWWTDLGAAGSNFAVTFPGGEVWTFATSFVESADFEVPLDEQITATMTVQLGAITVS